MKGYSMCEHCDNTDSTNHADRAWAAASAAGRFAPIPVQRRALNMR
jgi:hypothetical protein